MILDIKGTKEHGPGHWSRFSVRRWVAYLVLSLLAVSVTGCKPLPGSATEPPPTAATGTAYLNVELEPTGSRVSIDGQFVGTTPLVLEGPAGTFLVRVELDGYQPFEQEITLTPGIHVTIPGALIPLEPSADSLGAAPADTSSPLSALSVPMATGTPSQTRSRPTLVAGHSLFPSPPPLQLPTSTSLPATQTPVSTPSSLPSSSVASVQEEPTAPPEHSWLPYLPSSSPVMVHEEQIRIATYPYADFTTQVWNTTFNIPYLVLNRSAYEASNPTPREIVYRAVVIENEYLRLTFLPDVGGRLYEILFKPTGHRETYRNPVLKPSPWGPPEQGWWLAAGGLEWCFPVEEHGYEWGIPWQFQVSREGKDGIILLRDTNAGDRVRVAIAVRLEAGVGYFTIRPQMENPTSVGMNVKYWTNAMLAPGGRNAPSAGLRFVLPEAVTAVTVHSRGDDWLPDYNQRMSWPIFNGVDLSRLGNWNRWLGFFEDPAVGPFLAVYDEEYDEGIVRVFPAEVTHGAKAFAFGWSDPIPAHNWTDDGSSYVEVHGGPASTFDDSVHLPPGGSIEWEETWYPVAGLGRLRFANATAALNLSATSGQARLAVAVTRPWSGDVILLVDGQEHWRQEVSIVPGPAFRHVVSLGDDAPQEGRVTLRLQAPDGTIVAEYGADFVFR
ncbi:MAG: DUF5107 domain-containing protein [Anaerolineae bacterium]